MTYNPSTAQLEHINLTVSNPKAFADTLCDLLGWHVRWHGPSMSGGTTYHVGSEQSYLALYTRDGLPRAEDKTAIGALGHIGIVVPDLPALARKALAAGLTPYYFGDYTPGQRFYLRLDDNIECEFISYHPSKPDWWAAFQAVMAETAKAGMMR